MKKRIKGEDVDILSVKDPKEYTTERIQVFCIGSKGIPAKYGGFETFVENLTKNRKSDAIRYHVARMSNSNNRFMYNNAKCFDVKVPDIGAAKAIYYDIAALRKCIKYCKKRSRIEKPVFYIMACRVGPFIHHYKKQIEKLGGVLYVNPDGHEWKRSKWNRFVRMYWKLSEKLMVKYSDLLICDSKNIEKYIHKEYSKYNPKTTYISYGTYGDVEKTSVGEKRYKEWMKKQDLQENEYYLAVGRFVPENNYETMVREFMESNTDKKFAILTTDNTKFQKELERKLTYTLDNRIKFVGTVYDPEILRRIRESAFANIHGHEVGGTNPSLLEALSSTKINLLLNVGFNKEVAGDAALYWNKQEGSMHAAMDKAEKMSKEEIEELGKKAKARMMERYNWDYIVDRYEDVFINGVHDNRS